MTNKKILHNNKIYNNSIPSKYYFYILQGVRLHVIMYHVVIMYMYSIVKKVTMQKKSLLCKIFIFFI